MVNEKYINRCKEISQRSNCMRRKYGAILVKNSKIIGEGWNHIPSNIFDCKETGCFKDRNGIEEGDFSFSISIHAESDAIFDAFSNNFSPLKSKMYLYGEKVNGELLEVKPCMKCNSIIIDAGIETIYLINDTGFETKTRGEMIDEFKENIKWE